jgi:hypothetical protein
MKFHPDGNNTFSFEDNDLIKSLDELKQVKSLLQKINVSSSSLTSLTSSSLSSEKIISKEFFTASLEKNSPKSSIESKKLKVEPKNKIRLEPKWSITSLKNSMSITSCNFAKRPSPIYKKLTKKPSRQKISKIPEKKTKLNNSEPKVIETHFASCRINRYDDFSHTFEIIDPTKMNGGGDTAFKPAELVIVSLSTGETGIFATKNCKILQPELYQRESKPLTKE